VPLAPSLDHPGPMARTVADLALLLQAIAGHDPHDPTSANVPVPAYADALARPVAGLRLGVVRALFEGAEQDVIAAVETALHTCESLGMPCRDVPLPGLTGLNTGPIVYAESAAYHRARFGHPPPGSYSDAVAGYLDEGEKVLALTYLQARAACNAFRAECLATLREVDLLVAPTVPISAPPVDQAMVTLAGQQEPQEVVWPLLRNCGPFNAAGLPALSIPCGFTPRGLPVGLQIVGRPFDEETVLRAGHAYERESGWYRRQPAL
jgi:aspartyl-tRNA(Asn)/glutamyl-tRNA(Gln) amidotransferase subunit A